jgi:folate-binding protein YgfZ
LFWHIGPPTAALRNREQSIEQFMATTEQKRGNYLPLAVDRLVLTGSDRVKFLHGFCTADIKRMLPGELREAFVLNTKGKLVGHVQVLCGPDGLELVTWPGQATVLREHLDRYLIREKVEFPVCATETALFAWGESAPLLQDQPAPAPGNWSDLQLPTGRYLVAVGDFCGAGSLILPRDESARAQLDELAKWLETEQGLQRVAEEQLEFHRITQRYPRFGIDADSETLPQELQRDSQAISFDKGCYLGQETVARIDALGHVNRLLVRMRRLEGELSTLPADLLQAETRVGKLTSVAVDRGEVWGLGIVKRSVAGVGSQFQCGNALFTIE